MWTCSHLSNHKHVAGIRNSLSEILSVNPRVPQGSVLGLLLLFTHINNIVDAINPSVSVQLFADDCILFHEVSGSDGQQVCQGSLLAIVRWCHFCKMELVSDRTLLLRLTSKKNHLEYAYFIESTHILEVNKCKYLCLMENNLSWSTPINICSSAFRKLNLIHRKLKRTPSAV